MGNEVLTDAYTEIEKALTEVKGNAKSHSTVLIESESRDVKIRLNHCVSKTGKVALSPLRRT